MDDKVVVREEVYQGAHLTASCHPEGRLSVIVRPDLGKLVIICAECHYLVEEFKLTTEETERVLRELNRLTPDGVSSSDRVQ